MIMNNKILAVALIAVLIGASVGAIAMRGGKSTSTSTPVASSNNPTDNGNTLEPGDAQYRDASTDLRAGVAVPLEFKTA